VNGEGRDVKWLATLSKGEGREQSVNLKPAFNVRNRIEGIGESSSNPIKPDGETRDTEPDSFRR